MQSTFCRNAQSYTFPVPGNNPLISSPRLVVGRFRRRGGGDGVIGVCRVVLDGVAWCTLSPDRKREGPMQETLNASSRSCPRSAGRSWSAGRQSLRVDRHPKMTWVIIACRRTSFSPSPRRRSMSCSGRIWCLPRRSGLLSTFGVGVGDQVGKGKQTEDQTRDDPQDDLIPSASIG